MADETSRFKEKGEAARGPDPVHKMLRDRKNVMDTIGEPDARGRAETWSRAMGLAELVRSNYEMVEMLRKSGYADARVGAAMAKVDRKDFVGYADRRYAYSDVPIKVRYEQPNSSPSVIASMLTNLRVEEGMRVLEIGTCTGYQAAVIAMLVGRTGKVISVERIPALAEQAWLNISKYGLANVDVITGNGARGYEKGAPYDRIIFAAAARDVPVDAFWQLKSDGRMMAPVGGEKQELILMDKRRGIEWRAKLGPVRFVEMIDGEW